LSKKILHHPLFFLFVYLLIHFLLRITLSDTLQVDDREQIFYSQSLHFGYDMPQPPLYSWISYVFFKIFGVQLFTVTFVKYFLIFITFIYLFLAAEIVFKDRTKVKILLSSFLLMPSFAWHMHQGFTHTILLGLAISMTFFYFLKLHFDKKKIYYFLLGISIGIGLLSKYSYLIFLFLTLVSILISKSKKNIILDKAFLITLIVGLLISMPHYSWLIENWSQIFPLAHERLISSNNLTVFSKFREIILSSIGFLTPLVFVVLLIFLFSIRHLSKKNGKFIPPTIENFLDKYFIIMLILLAFSLVLIDIKEVKVRWLHPILMIFPFWLYLKAFKYIDLKNKFLKPFIISTVIFTTLVFLIRIVQMTIAPELGYKGRINTPIVSSLRKIPLSIINEIDTIKTDDYFLGPHIFGVFRDKRIIILKEAFRDIDNSNLKNCLIIWDNDGYDDNHKLKFEKFSGKINNKYGYSLFYKFLDNGNCK